MSETSTRTLAELSEIITELREKGEYLSGMAAKSPNSYGAGYGDGWRECLDAIEQLLADNDR